MQDAEHIEQVEHEPAYPEKERKPGELYFLIFLAVLACVILVEAFKMDGIQKGTLDASGTIPQVAAITILLLIAGLIFGLFRDKYKEGSIKEIYNYLFSREVFILLGTVILFAVILEKLHFKASSLIFLWLCMYLLDRKRPLHKLLISVCTVAGIVLVFHYAMQVILP